MKFSLKKGNITSATTDLLVIGCFEGEKQASLSHSDGGKDLDKQFAGKISQLIKTESFQGKVGEKRLLFTAGQVDARYVLVLGLGKKSALCGESLRKIGISIAEQAQEVKANSASLVLQRENLANIAATTRLQLIVEGCILGSYRFEQYKSEPAEVALKTVDFLSTSTAANLQKAITAGNAIGEGACLTRDLGNIPSNDLTPTLLARAAKKIAQKGKLSCKVHGKDFLTKEKMGLFLAVSKGSAEAPALIHLRYKPTGKAKAKIALVGKGVTFDTGGMSLKPPKSMLTMKADMGGAATVLGTMYAIARIKPNVQIDAYTPAAENMPDGKAYKPDDIHTARNGKTVEIISTDAEGRLLLADTLSYVSDKKPDYIIDLATLTGGCLVAMGEIYTAMLSNNERLSEKLLKASTDASEYMWRLPLEPRYLKTIQSGPADLKNAGGSRAQTATAALFLQEFVGESKWAHLDIASSAWSDEANDLWPQGATGATVATLVEFLRSF